MRSLRSLEVIVLSLSLAGAGLGVGCGGATTQTQETVVQPTDNDAIDPDALVEFQAGVRDLGRPGRRAREEARAHFEEALRLSPGLWEARYNLAFLDRQSGNLVAAAEGLEAARLVAPEAGDVLVALAEVQSELGNSAAASQLLRGYVSDHPEDLHARVALATLLRAARDYDGALEQARETLVRDPRNAGALAEVGRVYRAREQLEVAELVFRKALDLGETAELHNDLGLLELSRGDTQAAFEAFQRAITLDPTFSEAHENQGSVLLHAGDYPGAAAEFRAVLEHDEEDVEARVALAICLRGQGEHQAAQREYEAALERAPSHAAALYDYAILRAEFLDQRPQSIELFQRFLAVAPGGLPEREIAERYVREITAEQNAPPPPPPSEESSSEGGEESSEPMDL
ncbi:MAG: tetratricopeptide repeat protein [Sandaracinaceae bacterium]|nr:tetratricopeptide repeat protein [Sandaracinaceae bacterium]